MRCENGCDRIEAERIKNKDNSYATGAAQKKAHGNMHPFESGFTSVKIISQDT